MEKIISLEAFITYQTDWVSSFAVSDLFNINDISIMAVKIINNMFFGIINQ